MAKARDPQKNVTPGPAGLADAAQHAGARGLPPVHDWNPPHCGDSHMRIARDGTWYHEGSPITRPAMVRLFSTILRRDGDGYVLVTPVEKVDIAVDDAPFVAFDVTQQGDDLAFTTNVGDVVVADADHPIRISTDPATGEPSPYVLVRDGLEALIDRKTFYRMVEMGETQAGEGAAWFGVRSGGTFHRLIPAAALPDPD